MNIQFVFVFEYVRNVASCTFAYRSFCFIKIISNWYLDWFWRNSYGFLSESWKDYVLYYVSNLNKLKSCLLHQTVSRIVVAGAKATGSGVWPFMDADAVVTWREETAMSGWHEGNLMVGLSQTLFSNVSMGRPITTRWKRPLVKARSVKVKGVDFRVNLSRVRLTGGLGGGQCHQSIAPSTHTCRKMWCHV